MMHIASLSITSIDHSTYITFSVRHDRTQKVINQLEEIGMPYIVERYMTGAKFTIMKRNIISLDLTLQIAFDPGAIIGSLQVFEQ